MSNRTDDEMAADLDRPLTQQEIRNAIVLAGIAACGDNTATKREEDLAILVLRFAEALQKAEARTVPARRCAQCVLNGAGDFAYADEGGCENPRCVTKRGPPR